MDLLSWFRRFLPRTPQSTLKATRAKADQGDAEAQFGLGLKYGIGPDDLTDFAQAAQWFRKAADQDHSLAQFNLGIMLAAGRGVPRNDVAALSWFRKAAEGGDGGGQYMLGMKYHRTSVDNLQPDAMESRIEAYKWFHLSAAQGYRGSEAAHERLTLGMSHEEISEGNQRAASFVARQAPAVHS